MDIDYEKLSFKAGLEIHQQLNTSKLFCNCPSLLRKDESDFKVKRKLHAVAGESGEVDVAAQYQAILDKEFIYEGYDTTCLVELDEEPPHEINLKALKIALQIGFLMNMKVIPITQIMRKTVIDGSNTSGFQRTVLIAQDGYIETSLGKVKIKSLFLEEDAARTIGEEKNVKIYRLDRLGIPLVEIVTEPDLKNAEHAKEVALKIGEILRKCNVKRGLGTIRQDINISIKNENRVEIKGMQNMKIFVEAIENEVLRQKKLSENKNPVNMEVRNVLSDSSSRYIRPLPGSARMYPETDLPLLRISRKFIDEVRKTIPDLEKDDSIELREKGLNNEMINLILKQNKVEEFKEFLNIIKDGKLIAKILLIFPKEIAKKENLSLSKVDSILNSDVLSEVLENVKKGKISKSDIKHVLEKIVKGEELKNALKMKKESIHFIEEKIHKLIKDKPGLSENAYMGLVMKEMKGKIDGSKVREIIKRYLR